MISWTQFLIDFLLILGSSWVDFWWALGAKLKAKLTKKSIIWALVGKLAEVARIPKDFNFFQYPRPSNFETNSTKKHSQTDQKSSKNLVSTLIQFLIDFGNNLGRFWDGFGGQVGAELAPNGTRTRPHNQSKK